MKKTIGLMAGIGAASFLGAATGLAQNYPGEVYFNGSLGGALQQDMRVKNAGGKVGFDPGVRFDFSGGINFSPYISAELETGIIGNRLDTFNGISLSSMGQHGYLTQVPLLANLIFRAPLRYGITPYIGGGVGGVASTLYLRQPGDRDSDTDINFAYQGMAGVKFALNRNMEVGVGYKFLGTPPHTWFRDDPNLYTRSGQMFSHSILATFTFNF
jgi:OOP family OmpA-OmpF porin